MMNRGVTGVRVTEVSAINWFSGSNNGWQEGWVLGVKSASGSIRLLSRAANASAVFGCIDDDKGFDTVRQFGDAIFGGVALDSDASGDAVADFEENLIVAGIDAFLMMSALVGGQNFEDFGGEVGLVLGEAKEVVNGSNVAKFRGWWCLQ